jgi:hypothetical protein
MVRVFRFLGSLGAVSMVGTFAVVPVAFTFLPVPAGADAVTLCFPGFGPLQQFAGDLTGELEEIVVVHEGTHAQQCREMGATAWANRYRTVRGRIELEAEAFCAEIDLLTGRGLDRETLIEPRVQMLRNGYGNHEALSEDDVRAIMWATCGPRVAAARGPTVNEVSD